MVQYKENESDVEQGHHGLPTGFSPMIIIGAFNDYKKGLLRTGAASTSPSFANTPEPVFN